MFYNNKWYIDQNELIYRDWKLVTQKNSSMNRYFKKRNGTYFFSRVGFYLFVVTVYITFRKNDQFHIFFPIKNTTRVAEGAPE